jgi:GAF domain-containing protein
VILDPYHLTLLLVALITGVISPVVLQITKFFLLKSSSSKITKYKDTNKDEELIIKKLENLLVKYKADRAWIAEFHNGETNYSGKSFQKFSETYEEVAKGISSEALNTQSIPTSIFVRFFNELNTKGFYFLKDVRSIGGKDMIGLSLESFLETRSIVSYLAIAIKDINNNFVGVLCLDGVHEPFELTEEDIRTVTYTAANLAGYLENVESKQ